MLYKISNIIKSFSRNERRVFLTALVVFLISAVLFSINIFYKATTATPARGGSYTEGLVGQPVAINPLIAGENEVDRDLITLLFSPIVDLAEEYKPDELQKNWTIRLKPDLKWSDGEPLTADDVVFTIGIIQDPDTRSPLFATWQGVTTERLSEREVRLTIKNSYVFFADNLKNLRIAPQHIFDGIPPQNFRLSDYNLKPVGSGSYQFVNYDKRGDGFITNYYLAPNPYYALKRPLIKNFNIKFFTDKADALTAFNRRAIDGLGGIDSNDIENLAVNYKLLEINTPRYYAIFFNPGINAALKEKDVRIALDDSINKPKIIETVFGGRADLAFGPIPTSISGFDDNIYASSTFSKEAAVARLEKAGWKLNNDGVREKVIQKTKMALDFEIIVPSVRFLVDAVSLVKEDWQEIGVRLNPVVLKSSEVASQALKTRNYQMIIFGNILNNNPDVFSFWHSSQRFSPGLNLALFGDKTADTLLESIRQNTNDQVRQQELSKIQKIIYDNRPAAFLFSPKYLYAATKNLGGFDANFIITPANRFDNVGKWYVKTARVFK